MKYCFMPLHGGTDDFLSPEHWERFYAPSLRKVIERELELGLIPYIFFEGKYNNRLEMIRDLLPAGVKIYLFSKGFLHAKTLVCDDDKKLDKLIPILEKYLMMFMIDE